MPTVWPCWIDQGTCGDQLGVWNAWTQPITITAATTNVIWNNWVVTGTAATNYVAPLQAQVWNNWQTQTQITPIYAPVMPAPPPTPEQRAEREARAERARREAARNALIYRNRERARKLRRKPAERRAEALLLDHLSETQREEWAAERAFTVYTAEGKRAYKIGYGLAGNVTLVKADEPPVSRQGYPLAVGRRFCMHVYHPDGWVPNEDNVLAQKLLIEANERHFLDLANVS